MRSTNVTYTGADGARRAAGLYYPPDNRPQALAVFAHCLPSGAGAALNVGRTLNDFGLAVLNLDLVEMSKHGAVDSADIVAASRAVVEDLDLPILLIGHSIGGLLTLRAAGEVEQTRAVALISTPSSLTTIQHTRVDGDGDARRIRVGTASVKMTHQTAGLFDDEDVDRAIRLLRRPLIMFHSPHDEEVDVQSAQRIYRTARHPKSFIALDHADHFLSDEYDSRYASTVLAAWARRYLDIRTEATIYADVKDNRVSARTGRAKYRTEIIANGYPLVADEPESLGGTNMGPTPYDYLAAALGACTSMTLRMYADHKDLPLDAVTTRVRHSKVHVKDCEDCPEEGRHLDRLEREIELEGDLTDAQRKRMVEIANRCPVHRTLQSEVEIPTSLSEHPVAIMDDSD